MFNPSQIKAFVLLAAIAALTIGSGVWYFGSARSLEVRADDARLRNAIDPGRAPVRTSAPKRQILLASIPWKRDDDVFVPMVVDVADLPWQRDRDHAARVDLPLCELPWRR